MKGSWHKMHSGHLKEESGGEEKAQSGAVDPVESEEDADEL